MARHISDNSRKYSLLALGELSEIKKEYSSAPKIASLDKYKTSYLNDKMRNFLDCIKKTRYKGFSFLKKADKVRDILERNATGANPQEIEEGWREFFAFMDDAELELKRSVSLSYSQNTNIRQFEKFGSKMFGDETARKKITQALSDSLDGSVPNEEKFPFAADFPSQEIEKFLLGSNKKEKELLDFAANHSELSAQVQAEILGAIQDAYEETDIENPNNPFFGENKFVQDFQGLSEGKIFSSLESHRESLYKTQTGKENSADFDFYKNQNEKFLSKKNSAKPETKNKDLEALSPQTLARNLKSDLQKSLQERFLAWQIAEIDKKRKAFLKELYKRIEQFKKLEELLSPFAKSFGRLWDLSRRAFNDCGFEVLKDFADLLEKDESLKELADLIGRQDAEEERYETELREKIELKTEYHPKNAYKGQISGLRLGGEISAVVPSELAMSKNPMAKLYFAQKFAEKKLLSYKYENQVRSVREERSTEEIETPVKEKKQKGPVIICVDTSGSMSGSPERVAKTVTFALAKKCLEENRKCYLISFSTGIEVQDLSEFKKASGLQELVKFLRKSFNGGTDTEPALKHSLSLLQKNDWKNADVLVVSDMATGNLSDEITKSIEAQQEKETKFYSLVIGNSGNKNVIAAFDENWTYDDSSRDSMRHLVHNIRSLERRKKCD